LSPTGSDADVSISVCVAAVDNLATDGDSNGIGGGISELFELPAFRQTRPCPQRQ